MSFGDTTAIPLRKLSCPPTLGLLTTLQPATQVAVGEAGAAGMAGPVPGGPAPADVPPALAPNMTAHATSPTQIAHRQAPPPCLVAFCISPLLKKPATSARTLPPPTLADRQRRTAIPTLSSD